MIASAGSVTGSAILMDGGMMETLPAKRPLSVSQYNSFNRCGYAWYLDRILKHWNRPAAWLPQGSAVHTVAEHIERSKLSGTPLDLEQAQDLFREEYSKEVGQYADTTPNFDWWFASGPYRGQQDIERRYLIGLEQVEKMMGWTDSHPDEVIWIAPAVIDDRCSGIVEGGHDKDCRCRPETPGIEIAFDIELDGIRVRGFIDAVLADDHGQVYVRDYKTGNSPGDDFQLGVYGVALSEMYGVVAPAGDYFMAGKQGKPAKPTYQYDLTEWTRDKVSQRFQELDADIKAEKFEPKPEPSKCMFCSVNFSCEYSLA